MYTLFIAAFPQILFTFQLIDMNDESKTLPKQWFAFAGEAKYQLKEILGSNALGDKINQIIVYGPKDYIGKYVDEFAEIVKDTDIVVEGKEAS